VTARCRTKVIAASAIIIRTIMEMLGQQECLVSDFGLREGVLSVLSKQERLGEEGGKKNL
jgi:exopolyphosphatase/guanosine-5'-triphosphate,3'-diphosphate pyrophosphatase